MTPRFHSLRSLLGSLLSLTLLNSVHAAADVQAPILRGFAVSTPTVNVDQPDAAIVVNLRATDNQSGVLTLALTLSSPNGEQTIERWYSLPAPNRAINGPFSVGAFNGQSGFNSHSAAGPWKVQQIQLIDANDNTATYRYADLAALGRATFTVTSTQSDTHPPELVSGTLNTTSLSVSRHQAGTQKPLYASATLRLRDDAVSGSSASGIRWAQLVLCKPDGTGNCLERIDLAGEAPRFGLTQTALQVGGSLHDVTPGTFQIFSITLMDMAGNSHWMQSTAFQGEVDFSQYFTGTTLTLTP